MNRFETLINEKPVDVRQNYTMLGHVGSSTTGWFVMSNNRLTRAAWAAGYAMVHSDDIVAPAQMSHTAHDNRHDNLNQHQDERRKAPTSAATANSYTTAAQQWFGAFVGKAAT